MQTVTDHTSQITSSTLEPKITAKSKQLFSYAFAQANPDFYSPAEDTFLFLDVLETELATFDLPSAGLALEIGPGSGVLSAFFVRKTLEMHKCFAIIAVDVNRQALKATAHTFANVAVPQTLMAIEGDAVSGFLRTGNGELDVILCNPPYVPAARDELAGDPLVAAYAGGLPDGREVTDAVVALAARSLKVGGVLWLLLDERNKPQDVRNMANELGLQGVEVGRRKIPGELLSVWRYTK
jgi:release factor glutamine methyltransferase